VGGRLALFQAQGMDTKTSRYESRPKRFAPSNPVILGKRSAFWVFWIMAAVVTVMIVGAVIWLLTHPLAALN
jgi:hypothetical protein